MHSTGKVVHPVESPLSAQAVSEIRNRIDPKMDRFELPEGIHEFTWPWPWWIKPKQRLHVDEASDIQKYINAIIKQDFPFYIRELMGRHLWVEFCEYYAINPDKLKAMRYL